MKKHERRANGTGSVFLDKQTGRWVAQILDRYETTAEGKLRPYYKRKFFKTRTEALLAVGSLKEAHDSKPEPTLSYYYHAYEKGKGAKLSASKQTAYRIAYDRLRSLHGRRLSELSIVDLQKVVNETCETYYPARDVRAVLNNVYKLAAADGLVNPVLPSLIDLPSKQETIPDPFTEEEQLLLWYAYENGQASAALPLILIYTGLMTGEVRKLTKDMIDLDKKEIVGVGIKTEERKKRSVLLPDDILPVLEDAINAAETDRLYPMSEDRFYELYYAALEQAGITRHLTPYSCRHTTATVLAVHAQTALQVLQRIMRWSSTRMMDRYVTPTDDDARKAINRF